MEIKLPLGGLPSASQNDVASALPLTLLKPLKDGAIDPVKSVKKTDSAQESGQNAETQREVLARTSELVSMLDIDLKFEVHEDAGIVQIQVIDTADGRVLRKIPADEVLKLVSQIREKMSERVDVRA